MNDAVITLNGLETVSYTHLDVYKRQIQDIIAEVRKTASYVNYNWRDA